MQIKIIINSFYVLAKGVPRLEAIAYLTKALLHPDTPINGRADRVQVSKEKEIIKQ